MILIVDYSSLRENDVQIQQSFKRLLPDATAVKFFTWVRSPDPQGQRHRARTPVGEGLSAKFIRAVITVSYEDRSQHNGALAKMINGSISSYKLVDIDARFKQIYSSVEAVLAPTLYDWYHKLNQTYCVKTDTGVDVQDSIQLKSVTFKGFLLQIFLVRQLLWNLSQENKTIDAGSLPVISSLDEIFSDVRAYCEKVPDVHGTGEWPQLMGANVELSKSGNGLSIRGQLEAIEAIEPVICDLVNDPSHALWVKPSKPANGVSHNERNEAISLHALQTEETFDKDVFDFLLYVKKKEMDKALGAPFEATFRIKGVTEDGHYYVIELQRPDIDKQLMDKLNCFFTMQAGKTHSQLITCSTEAWKTEQSQHFQANRDFVFRVLGIGSVKVTAELDRLDAAIAKVKSLSSISEPSSNGLQQRESVSLPPPPSGPLLAKLELNIDKMKVFIYQKDITKVTVESIANAANETLSHGGGVANAIAQAAGRSFEEEGKHHIKDKGVMAVGDVYAQRACGSLVQHGIKSVINVVGPRYSSALGPDRLNACRSSLTLAITNTLAEAERLRLRSVAIPAISSGIFGVPMDVCCDAYWDGLNKFIESRKSCHLKDVHFVNIDRETTSRIQQAFQAKNSMSKGDNPKEQQQAGSTSSGLLSRDSRGSSKSSNSTESDFTRQELMEQEKKEQAAWDYDFNKVKIFIVQQDITTAKVDAIVNAANGLLQHTVGVSGAIAKATGKSFLENGFAHVRKNGPLRVGSCYAQRAEGKLNTEYKIKHVIHAVGPSIDEIKDVQKCKQLLIEAIVSSLQEAELLSCKTVAIPAISSGQYGVPLDVCTKAYWEAAKIFCDQKTHQSLSEVRFTNIDARTTLQIKQDFSIYADQNQTGKPDFLPKHTVQSSTPGFYQAADPVTNGNQLLSTANQKVEQVATKTTQLLTRPEAALHEVFQQNQTEQIPAQADDVMINDNQSLNSSGQAADDVTKENQSLTSPDQTVNDVTQKNTEEHSPNQSSDQTIKDSQLIASTNLADNDATRGHNYLTNPDKAADEVTQQTHHQEHIQEEAADQNGNSAVKRVQAEDTSAAVTKSTVVQRIIGRGRAKPDIQIYQSPGYKGASVQMTSLAEHQSYSTRDSGTLGMGRGKLLATASTSSSDEIGLQEHSSRSSMVRDEEKIVGGQPEDGKMKVETHLNRHLHGFPKDGTIVIEYKFKPKQKKEYKSKTFTAYLPNNDRGKKLLKMLRVAFDRRLTFTIDKDKNELKWASVHHKTNEKGSNGYPDDGYLSKLEADLEALGIFSDEN